jgi:hypothetical protein
MLPALIGALGVLAVFPSLAATAGAEVETRPAAPDQADPEQPAPRSGDTDNGVTLPTSATPTAQLDATAGLPDEPSDAPGAGEAERAGKDEGDRTIVTANGSIDTLAGGDHPVAAPPGDDPDGSADQHAEATDTDPDLSAAPMITVDEAGRRVGASPRQIQRWIETGVLATVDVDGARMVRPMDLAGAKRRAIEARHAAFAQQAAAGPAPTTENEAGADEPTPAGEAGSAAVTEGDGAVGAGGRDPAAEPAGFIPLDPPTKSRRRVSSAGAPTRTIERARRRSGTSTAPALRAADEPEGALGPMFRHLNAVTLQLAEAHRVVGRMMAERDAYQRQLAELQGLPVPVPEDDPFRPKREARADVKEARAEAKAAKQAERATGTELAVIDPELLTRAEEVGRRRRLIALGLLAVIGIAAAIGWQMNIDFPDSLSREDLGRIAFLGPVFQIFIAGWFIYRIARIGGKGARWLFPEPEKQRKRRR